MTSSDSPPFFSSLNGTDQRKWLEMPLRSCGLDRRQRSLFSLEHQRSKRRRMDTKANREILNVEKNTWPSKKCQMTSPPPQRMPHSPPPFPTAPARLREQKKTKQKKTEEKREPVVRLYEGAKVPRRFRHRPPPFSLSLSLSRFNPKSLDSSAPFSSSLISSLNRR